MSIGPDIDETTIVTRYVDVTEGAKMHHALKLNRWPLIDYVKQARDEKKKKEDDAKLGQNHPNKNNGMVR